MLKLSFVRPLYYRLGTLTLLSCLGLTLSACSIEKIVYEDAKIEGDFYKEEPVSDDPVDIFIAECNKCVKGDISKLPELIKIYYSSFTPSNKYQEGHFIYQQIKPTQAFEKCAEKANAMGDKSAFSQLMIRPARIARTARFFYIQKDYRQGAYWIQRLVNINGEMDGLQVAGRIFIQDMRTIDIGVRMLEQSARLGNREAKQMLLGLMQPGSSYYQSITSNALLDEERSTNTKDDAAAASTIAMEQEQKAEAQAAAAEAQAQAQADSATSTVNQQDMVKGMEQLPSSDQATIEQSSVTSASDASNENADGTSAAESSAAPDQAKIQAASTTVPAKASSSASEENDVEQLTPEFNLPARKLSEQAERIQQLKARADAAAAAAEMQQQQQQNPQPSQTEFQEPQPAASEDLTPASPAPASAPTSNENGEQAEEAGEESRATGEATGGVGKGVADEASESVQPSANPR